MLIAVIYRRWQYQGGSRYYYSAVVTAPATHPVKIRNSYFILADGNIGSIANSDANSQRTEWGNGDFPLTHRRERLPVKLVLEYCSYRDSKFYKDTINLPEQKLKSIFETALAKGIFQSIYSPGGDVLGLNFLIGIANTGNIIVWLQGANSYETVVLKHKIADKEPVGDQLYYNKILSKKEYLKQAFEYMDSETLRKIDSLKDRKENYIDSATNYSSRPLGAH